MGSSKVARTIGATDAGRRYMKCALCIYSIPRWRDLYTLVECYYPDGIELQIITYMSTSLWLLRPEMPRIHAKTTEGPDSQKQNEDSHEKAHRTHE